jgi:hypothetical protein
MRAAVPSRCPRALHSEEHGLGRNARTGFLCYLALLPARLTLSQEAAWMLPERGGDQGDYRAGIRAKINNAIECLKMEPLSKRAVSADSCAAPHLFCLIMSADNPDPV